MTKFYVLDEPNVDSDEDKRAGTKAYNADDVQRGDAPRCSACGDLIGHLVWLPPYRAELETWGREFGDIIFEGRSTLLVSERFKRVYEEHGLKGFAAFEPVEIYKIKRRRKLRGDPPPYFKVDVPYSAAAVDQKASGMVWERNPCPTCLMDGRLYRYERIVITPPNWKAEDIFYPRGGPVNFIVSQRFRDVCVENNVSNVVFTPAKEHRWEREAWEP